MAELGTRAARRWATASVVAGSFLITLALLLAGRGDQELSVSYRTEWNEAPCPTTVADSALFTALAVVNSSPEPHGARCTLVGRYHHAWLTGGGTELLIDRIQPWYSAPFVLVVEPDHPSGNSYSTPIVRCVAT